MHNDKEAIKLFNSCHPTEKKKTNQNAFAEVRDTIVKKGLEEDDSAIGGIKCQGVRNACILIHILRFIKIFSINIYMNCIKPYLPQEENVEFHKVTPTTLAREVETNINKCIKIATN